jgi:phage tail sheath protein FI
MPETPTTYPGVYVEELTNSVRTIIGVSTSITAFIGRALKGPVNDPILIHNFEDFRHIFGGLWIKSNMSYAVYQYFQNEGKDALIVRVHNGATKSTIDIGGAFVIEAATEGAWSRNLEIKIEPVDQKSQDSREAIDAELAIDPAGNFTLFNLFVLRRTRPDHEPEILEAFRLLSTKSLSSSFVGKVLVEESDLIRVRDPGTVQAIQPKAAPPSSPQPCQPGPPTTYKTGTSGDDGAQPRDQDIFDSDNPKNGILALDKADLFSLLCIPPYSDSDVSPDVYSSALTYCEKRRAMLIIDPPSNWNSAGDPMKDSIGIDSNNGFRQLRHDNAAIFFPHIKAQDPEMGNRKREFVPCGVVAGVIARTDAERGVWKSPAGIEATLKGVSDLTVKITDTENANLNSRGINCLRILPSGCIVVWGARTMSGANRLADQWKYIPVRRTALYIEESLYTGTEWAVFEPNDEPLWAQIRLNVGAFMHDLFLKGAFRGTTPNEAYLVKCDRETTTQKDIDRGIVNIVVGFAPLKPAEFVIIQISQLAGRTRGG